MGNKLVVEPTYAMQAACYIMPPEFRALHESRWIDPRDNAVKPIIKWWPTFGKEWEPLPEDRIAELMKAKDLIDKEIERLKASS